MKKNYLESFIYSIILVLIIGLPSIKLLSYILYLYNIVDDTFVVNNVYLLWGVLPILVIIYLVGIITKKYKFTYIDITMLFLMFFAGISTIFAKNSNTALFGEIYRYEGLISILSYYFIFLNSKNISNEQYKKNIINIFLIVGMFQVFYGLLQVFTNFSFIKHYSKGYMAMGLCGNPNFFGSYMILEIMLSSFLYLTSNKKRYIVPTIIFFIGLILSGSTGPFLSFIITLVFGIICFHKKITFKKVLVLIVTLIFTYFSIDYFVNLKYNNPTSGGIDRNYNISTEIIDTVINNNKTTETIGNGRLTVWKNSIPLVKEYWLLGAGLDNFGEVYPVMGHVRFDKAHNVYLQVAITNGCIVLVTYLLIYLFVFIKGIKIKEELYIAIYMAFIGYCIQAFANISVIDIAPCFYIILGLLWNRKKELGSDISGTLL